MAFKVAKDFIAAADEPAKKEKENKKQQIVYLTESNADFLQDLRFKYRKQKLSMSDFINEAVEQYLKKKYK